MNDRTPRHKRLNEVLILRTFFSGFLLIFCFVGVKVNINAQQIELNAFRFNQAEEIKIEDSFNLSGNDLSANNAGNLLLRTKLRGSDLSGYHRFGDAVAMNGSTLIVGAPSQNNGTVSQAGAAYIFVRTNGVWAQQAKLVASDPTTNASFGNTVAIHNNTALVTASGGNMGSLQGVGAVYVFVRNGTTWTQQAKLIPNAVHFPEIVNSYGWAISVHNDTVVVGSPADVIEGRNPAGSAYVFSRNGSAWSQVSRFTSNRRLLGLGVAVENDVMVIGEPDMSSSPGKALIIKRTGSTWAYYSTLYGLGASDRFGFDIDISGGRIIVGAPSLYVYEQFVGGAVVFKPDQFNSSGYSVDGVLVDEEGSLFNFGSDVALSGNIAIIRDKVFFRTNGGYARRALPAINSATGWANDVEGKTIVTLDATDLSNRSVAVYEPLQTLFDFDGDRQSDLSVTRGGDWYINNSTAGFFGIQFGTATDKLAPGDFNGDGITDVSVYRDGFWYRIRSGDNVFVTNQFGAATDIPVSGDFDGNGGANPAVFRPSNGTWYWLLPTLQAGSVAFGAASDKPVPADFDGDGTTDVAVFRPSNGNWYWLNSSNRQFNGVAFGQSGDVPIVGDFDGDGKADPAVFRPAVGTWYILRSTAGFTSVLWGVSTDKPVAADYDGDGKTDVAIFRDGLWVILRSSGGVTTTQFGTTGDKPVPAAFVQ